MRPVLFRPYPKILESPTIFMHACADDCHYCTKATPPLSSQLFQDPEHLVRLGFELVTSRSAEHGAPVC